MALKREQVKAMFAKWGFDTTDFKKGGFQNVVKQLNLFDKPQKFFTTDLDGNPQQLAWEWRSKKHDVTVVTVNNPITGEDGRAIFKRPNEKDFAGSIGVEGEKLKVEKAIKLIRDNATHIKGESPNDRDFV